MPSGAWVDEVKTLKKGDVYMGRGSKQRGLLPSFWTNQFKVSKYGRDRAVELHRTEVQEDPQYRSGYTNFQARGYCSIAVQLRSVTRIVSPRPCSAIGNEKIVKTARNRNWKTHRPMLRKAGQAQTNQCSWDQGTWKGGYVTVKVSVRPVRGRQGITASQLWTSISRLFLATAESLSSVQLLSELALGRHAKSPFSQRVVDQLRGEVKVILAREDVQFERVEGDRTDMPIDFRLGRPVESSSRSRSIDCNLRARGTSRPGI